MWKHLVWRRRNIGQRKYLIYDEAETKFYTSPSHTTSDILSISHDLSLLLSNSPKSKFKNGKNINYFTFQQGSRPALIYVDKILKLLKKNKTLNWIVFFNSEKILVCLKRFMVNRGGDHAWMLISLGSEKKKVSHMGRWHNLRDNNRLFICIWRMQTQNRGQKEDG